MAQFTGFGLLGEPDNAAIALQEQQYQLDIARCMAEQGFEYVPESVSQSEVAARRLGNDLTRDEYAAQYGFAISTSITEFASQPLEEQASPGENPNGDLLAALGEAERDAWIAALEGPDRAVGEPPGGCLAASGQARQETARALDALQADLQELRERVNSHPLVVDAQRNWSRCMGDRGHNVASLDDLFEQLWREYLPIEMQVLNSHGDSGDLDLDALDPSLRDSLARQQEREIAAAQDSLACDVGLDRTRNSVATEIEADYIAANPQIFSELNSS